MSDVITLLIVLTVFYLTDCFIWLRRQSVGFVCRWGLRWSYLEHGGFWMSTSGRPALLNPLPPLGAAYFAHIFPISISPATICSAAPDVTGVTGLREAQILSFDDIEDISVSGVALKINNKKFAHCVSEAQAQRLCSLISYLKPLTEEQRECVITEFFKSRFDINTAHEEMDRAQPWLEQLKLPCNLLFCLLFVAFPAISLTCNLLKALLWVMLPTLLLSTGIVVFFVKAHKKLFPHGADERTVLTVKMLLFPPSAIRARDKIAVEMLSVYHPLIVARLVFDSTHFSAFADRWMRRSLQRDIDEETIRAMEWQDSLERALEMHFVQAQGVSETRQQPAVIEPGANSYCPKCLSQYTTVDGACSDCGCSLESLVEIVQ